MLGEPWTNAIISKAGLLAASGHFDIGFLGFPLSFKENTEVVPLIQIAITRF
jgi:hypothetical protein